jgi:hypothetical protein
MFEDFRKQADESSFESHEAETEDLQDELEMDEPEVHFLGMTPAQRFALLVLLFVMTSIVGILFLLLTNRLELSFLG